jgi:hypothetical protein
MKIVIVSDIHGNFEALQDLPERWSPSVQRARLRFQLWRNSKRCWIGMSGVRQPNPRFCLRQCKRNAMNLEALARDVIRPAIKESGLEWHGWHAFRRGLATNLHRLGISDKVIQQILRHANVTTTMNIYVRTVSSDAAAAMKTLQTTCATTVQPLPLASTRVIRNALGGHNSRGSALDGVTGIWRREWDSNPRYRC